MIETLKKKRGHQFMPTKAQLKKMPKIGEIGDLKNATVHVRYFSITGWEWYVVEMNPETTECFGLVKGFETEIGSFYLSEMEPIMKDGVFVAVERDLYFQPTKFSEIMEKVGA